MFSFWLYPLWSGALEATARFTSNYYLLHLGVFFLINRWEKAGPQGGNPQWVCVHARWNSLPYWVTFHLCSGSDHLHDFKNIKNSHFSPFMIFVSSQSFGDLNTLSWIHWFHTFHFYNWPQYLSLLCYNKLPNRSSQAPQSKKTMNEHETLHKSDIASVRFVLLISNLKHKQGWASYSDKS